MIHQGVKMTFVVGFLSGHVFRCSWASTYLWSTSAVPMVLGFLIAFILWRCPRRPLCLLLGWLWAQTWSLPRIALQEDHTQLLSVHYLRSPAMIVTSKGAVALGLCPMRSGPDSVAHCTTERPPSRALFAKIDYVAARWLCVLLLGDLQYLSKEEIQAFKQSGLFHALVLSGFHVSRFSSYLAVAVFWIFNILYAFKIIRSTQHQKLRCSVRLFVLSGLFIVPIMIPMFPPVQRATLATLSQYSTGDPLDHRQHQVLGVAMVLQVLLFPIDFLSISNALSWSGVFLLTESQQLRLPTFYQKCAWALIVQSGFLLLSLVLIGVWAPIGILSNFIFAPLLGFFVISGAVLWALPFIPGGFSYWSSRLDDLTGLLHYLVTQLPSSPHPSTYQCLIMIVLWIAAFICFRFRYNMEERSLIQNENNMSLERST